MPYAIAVRDSIFDPGSGDLIAATHGRSLWVLDDASFLAHLAEIKNKPVTLFPVRPALGYARRATRYGFGDQTFAGPNPEYGALLTYYLAVEATSAQIQILDATGGIVTTIAGAAHAGVNRAVWNLRYAAPKTGQRGARGVKALPEITSHGSRQMVRRSNDRCR